MTYINSEIKKRIILEIKWHVRIPYQRFVSLSKNINQKIFLRGYNATHNIRPLFIS